MDLMRRNRVQTNGLRNYPSFTKELGKYRTYLDLPKDFCVKYLPNHNDTVILLDENVKEFSVCYMVNTKFRFGRGWGDFITEHKLLSRDTMSFQLIDHCRLKVQIVRATQREANGRTTDSQTLETNESTAIVKIKDSIDDQIPTSSKTNRQEDHQPAKKKLRFSPESEASADPINDVVSPEPIVKFENVKSFNDFVVQYNGKTLQLPKKLAMNYYELCQSEGKFLHEGLTNSLTNDLAIGLIQEAVSVAEYTKGAQVSTAPYNMKRWKDTVNCLEIFGMSVEALHDRLNQLDDILREHKVLTESKKTKVARLNEERNLMRERYVEFHKMVKIMDAQKDLVEKLVAEIDPLDTRCRNLGVSFKNVASLPLGVVKKPASY